MEQLTKAKLLYGLESRFDFLSARTVFANTCKEAGLKDKDSYTADEVVAFCNAMAKIQPLVDSLIEKLQRWVGIEIPEPAPPGEPPVSAETAAPAAAPAEPEPAPEPEKKKGKEEPKPEPAGPVSVHFELTPPEVASGDTVCLIGSIPELGEWDQAKALALTASKGGAWVVDLSLAAGTTLEFKFFVRVKKGENSWEGGENRTFTVPEDKKAEYKATWQA